MAASKDMGGAVGNPTVIGPSILINGKLTGDEDLTVRGRVEGELSLTRTLIVETSGVVKADVTVRNAIVSGVVVGNIAASESVELTKEGRMVGDIRAPRVIIVDGASFRGRVDMGNAEPGTQRTERPRATAPASRPATTTRPAAAPPRPPPPPARTEARPTGGGKEAPRPPSPPPAPKAPEAAKPAPPAPPSVAAGAKKKVLIRKKGR